MILTILRHSICKVLTLYFLKKKQQQQKQYMEKEMPKSEWSEYFL